ncbi:hypothetical protein EDD30_6617 [Couchioplanes caeruleus]|uniref:Uncharacterized protein n=1 Tax=Couchioplanes caeruleus TaxID=56438 RepID=A0A3N1GTJ3_9ACTN|nr:hypothetical protein EDD30_6617 [Couchioplanes caeruleus]
MSASSRPGGGTAGDTGTSARVERRLGISSANGDST